MDITWNGDWFFTNKSHANINRGVILALHELGHNVRVTQISDFSNYDSKNESHRIVKHLTEHRFESEYNIFKFPAMNLVKEGPKFNCVLHSNGSYTISTRIVKMLKKAPITHLWLPTPDCADVVNRLVDIPVVGLGIDSGVNPDQFNMFVCEYDYEVGDKFKFIVACDGALNTLGRPFGGCRGTDIAIKAFVNEFNGNDNVCLIVKMASSYGFIDKYIDKLVSVSDNPPLIIKDFGKDNQDIIAQKWASANCMLSPIRDCRWEACCLESLACGTPVIATKCGGPLMYGKEGVEFVEYDLVGGDLCVSRGDVPVSKDYWTEPKIQGFMDKMRWMFDLGNNDAHKLQAIGERGSKHVLNNWKWVDLAKRIVNFFEEG